MALAVSTSTTCSRGRNVTRRWPPRLSGPRTFSALAEHGRRVEHALVHAGGQTLSLVFTPAGTCPGGDPDGGRDGGGDADVGADAGDGADGGIEVDSSDP